MTPRSEKVTFPGASGATLAGRLDLPEGDPIAYALFAHCFTCSKEVFAASRISAALAERGIAVLRFDFTGLGSSEGEFANTNFSSNIADLVAAADHLRARYRAPGLLIGHSLGGAAVLAGAARVPEARAVATINAPADPVHVEHLLASAKNTIAQEGEAEVAIGGRPFTIKKQFLEDLSEQRMSEAIHGLRRALLIFHAPTDEVVAVDNARRIFATALHPKSFVALDGADHLLTRKSDAVYAAAMLAAWAPRYLESEAVSDRVTEPPAAEPGTVVVTETRQGAYEQIMNVGRHTLLADEPPAFGGNDRGPSPYDLLMASLGACTSMTLRMYAERKGWPLEKVSVQLNHGKIHATDCAACETKEGKIDRFSRVITLSGPLDEEQRSRLLDIADKCPVHRTLHSENLVQTRLAEPGEA